MAVQKCSNFGNPYIGLFAKASDKLVAVDLAASPKLLKVLPTLGVPVELTTFCGSGLAGIFLAMNSNGVVLPKFSGKEEIAIFKRHGLNVSFISGPFSAVGNNIAANDFGAIVNPEMSSHDRKIISDALGVEVVGKHVAGFVTAGSCITATNKGFIAHNRSTEEELKEFKSILKVDGVNCTVNMGTAFVSLGVIANSKSALFGEATTGFEIGKASDALGVLA